MRWPKRLLHGEKVQFFGSISKGPAKKNSLVTGSAAGRIVFLRQGGARKSTGDLHSDDLKYKFSLFILLPTALLFVNRKKTSFILNKNPSRDVEIGYLGTISVS